MSLQDFSPKEEECLGSVFLEDFSSVKDLEAEVWTQFARKATGEDLI